MEELSQKLQDVVQRRDAVAAELQRIEGRREAAAKALASVESEIKKKKIKPKDIGKTIDKLVKEYEQLVDELETEVSTAEEAIAPYIEQEGIDL